MSRPLTIRAVAGLVMALAAAAPGCFLWKYFPPFLIVFLGSGLLIGGWLVGGALARGRGWRGAALMGALTALLCFPVVGFFYGFGEGCVDSGLALSCLSLEGGVAKTGQLIIDEAAKSVLPVALVGALAGLLARAVAPKVAPSAKRG